MAGVPHRIAGHLALDLANTVSWRGTPRETDHLADAEAVLRWAIDGGLIAASDTVAEEERAALVTRAHGLRAAIQVIGTALARGAPPPRAALCRIRDDAARALAHAELAGVPLAPRFVGVDRIVGAAAWAMFDLLRSPDVARLKQCPPDDCRWLFIDRTRNGSRRWCDMATCGNRAKQRRA